VCGDASVTWGPHREPQIYDPIATHYKDAEVGQRRVKAPPKKAPAKWADY